MRVTEAEEAELRERAQAARLSMGAYLQAVTVIELAPTDVCANCGARLLEETAAQDRA